MAICWADSLDIRISSVWTFPTFGIQRVSTKDLSLSCHGSICFLSACAVDCFNLAPWQHRLRASVGFVLTFATNCKNIFEQSCRSPAGRFLNRDALVQPPFLIISSAIYFNFVLSHAYPKVHCKGQEGCGHWHGTAYHLPILALQLDGQVGEMPQWLWLPEYGPVFRCIWKFSR